MLNKAEYRLVLLLAGGGYIGVDGNSSYFFDPSSGCIVMPDGGVSC